MPFMVEIPPRPYCLLIIEATNNTEGVAQLDPPDPQERQWVEVLLWKGFCDPLSVAQDVSDLLDHLTRGPGLASLPTPNQVKN